MSVKIGLLTKTPVTQVTLERLLFIVDVTHMSLQVRGYAKGSVTVFASKKNTPKQVGRKELVSSWKRKICPKIHDKPSGLSLSTQPQFLVSTEAQSSLTYRQILANWRAVLLEWRHNFYGGVFRFNLH